MQERNCLATVATIDMKIGIERKDSARVVELGHSYQACVRERRGDAPIALEQLANRRSLLRQVHAEPQRPGFQQSQDRSRFPLSSAEKMTRLSNDGLAGEKGPGKCFELFLRPRMRTVVACQCGDQGSRVEQDDVPCHRAKRYRPRSLR